MCLCRDQLAAQNLGAVLAVIVKLAADTIFAKFCQDALSITHSKTAQEYTNTGCGWDGWGWVGMGGDGWGWSGIGLDGGLGLAGWVTGRESCGQEMVLFTFQLHFFAILKVFGWVLGDPGLRLGSDWAP